MKAGDDILILKNWYAEVARQKGQYRKFKKEIKDCIAKLEKNVNPESIDKVRDVVYVKDKRC